MPTSRAGFSLLEVITAVAMLALASIVALKATVETGNAVAVGRRWTLMARAAEAELVRLEREFRRARPVCEPPASGTRYTPEGVGLDWTVAGDSLLVRVTVAVRAKAGGRVLADTVRTVLSCR